MYMLKGIYFLGTRNFNEVLAVFGVEINKFSNMLLI